MIASIVVASAVAMSPLAKPEPKRSPASWVLRSDLPAIDGSVAVTTFDLTIDEVGQPLRCDLIVPSSNAQLDNAVCAALMKRARFKPARGPNGSPVPAVRRDRVVWKPNAYGNNRWYDAPDIVVSTPVLEKEHKEVAEVLLAVEKDGSISNCVVSRSSEDNDLDRLACDIVRTSNVVKPILGRDNAPQAGLRSFFIGFETGASQTVQVR